jgi:hypothetical protein
MAYKTPNWRDELISTQMYVKHFAIFPKKCADGTNVWFKFYYSRYDGWRSAYSKKFDGYMHIDFIEHITEAEYIVRRLTEGT